MQSSTAASPQCHWGWEKNGIFGGKKGLFEVWDRCWRKGVSRLALGVANTCEKEMVLFQPEVLWPQTSEFFL